MITRIIAGLTGLAVVLPAIAWGGQLAVDVIVGVVLLLCVEEYGRMAFPDDRWVATGWTLLGAGSLWATALYRPEWIGPVAAVALLATLAFVLFRPGPDLSRAADRVGRYALGMAWIGGLLAFLPLLRRLDSGAWWVILALAISWLGDTGGYFAGRALGRHKLYPRVSPKKTWEGLAGSIALATVGVYVIRVLGLPQLTVVDCLLLGLGLGGLATVGDLSESLLKRAFAVKDTGRLLPGHGGFLDRIDSVLFVAPLVWVFAVLTKGL